MIVAEGIADAILAVPCRQGRRIIAIAGAPASGKSTLAEVLAKDIPGARVLPMDGFHRDNADLEAHGLLSRKGAPHTFDVVAFASLVRAARSTPHLAFPTFDRTADCVVPGGDALTPEDDTILVEGNYLLLKDAPWHRMLPLWDFTIMLDVPLTELERRLIARWQSYGFSLSDATRRAQANDLPNAKLVVERSAPADRIFRHC